MVTGQEPVTVQIKVMEHFLPHPAAATRCVGFERDQRDRTEGVDCGEIHFRRIGHVGREFADRESLGSRPEQCWQLDAVASVLSVNLDLTLVLTPHMM